MILFFPGVVCLKLLSQFSVMIGYGKWVNLMETETFTDANRSRTSDKELSRTVEINRKFAAVLALCLSQGKVKA